MTEIEKEIEKPLSEKALVEFLEQLTKMMKDGTVHPYHISGFADIPSNLIIASILTSHYALEPYGLSDFLIKMSNHIREMFEKNEAKKEMPLKFLRVVEYYAKKPSKKRALRLILEVKKSTNKDFETNDIGDLRALTVKLAQTLSMLSVTAAESLAMQEIMNNDQDDKMLGKTLEDYLYHIRAEDLRKQASMISDGLWGTLH